MDSKFAVGWVDTILAMGGGGGAIGLPSCCCLCCSITEFEEVTAVAAEGGTKATGHAAGFEMCKVAMDGMLVGAGLLKWIRLSKLDNPKIFLFISR